MPNSRHDIGAQFFKAAIQLTGIALASFGSYMVKSCQDDYNNSFPDKKSAANTSNNSFYQQPAVPQDTGTNVVVDNGTAWINNINADSIARLAHGKFLEDSVKIAQDSVKIQKIKKRELN